MHNLHIALKVSMHRWLQREFEWLSVFLVSGCALQTDPQGFTHMQFAEAHEFMLSASAWRDKKTNLTIFYQFYLSLH